MKPKLITEKTKAPLAACQLLLTETRFELLAADAAAPQMKREWSMLANTGKVIQRYWGSLVLDLEGAAYGQRVALLMDHATQLRLGFSTEIKLTPRGLMAKGKLLDNDMAAEVMKDSAAGFPFQASLMAVPSRVQALDEGEEAEVNGQKVTGPLSIFREWSLRELTVTVLGADSETATEAFAPKGEIDVAMQRTRIMDEETPAPAKPAANLNAAQGSKPQPAPAPENNVALAEQPKAKPEASAAELERKRASAILAAADPSQAKLARELVDGGTELLEALAKLNEDLRTRLAAAQTRMRDGTQPLGAGNGSGDDGSGEILVAAQLRSDTEEQWKAHFGKHASLRAEFSLPGESPARGEARFLALQRFAQRHLKGAERAAMLAVPAGAERLAAESHLQPLTVRGIRGDFYLGLEARNDSWVNSIATIYETDAPSEDYPFLGQVPRLRKFEGPRAIQQLNRGKLTIVNDDYEGTFQIEAKDWRRDKSPQMANHVQDMGQVAGELPIDLISGLLNVGSTTALAWDGIALFGSHTFGGSGTINNNMGTGDGLAGGATPTSAQMAANIFLAIQRMLSFKDDQGRPMNQSAKSFKLMVPINMIAATEAALADQFTSAGVSNTLSAAMVRGKFKISYEWNGRLTASDTFFLWRDDARVKPFIYQEEFVRAPYLLDESSEFFKRNNRIEVGANVGGGAAPGKYELIVRCKTA